MAHNAKGQNILFKDGSATFQDRVEIGIRNNHIWKYGDDAGVGGSGPSGTGITGEFPSQEEDSFLVNEMN